MKSVHVCLVSKQPIPNLVPLFLEKPEEAVLLVSPEMQVQARRLTKIAKPRGIKVREMEIPAYDFGEVSRLCEQLIKNYPAESASLSLNVTGGTKISALAAFQSFFFSDSNPRIIYLDSAAGKLKEIAPSEKDYFVGGNVIRLREYLAAYGFQVTGGGRPVAGFEQRRACLPPLAEMLVSDEVLLGRLNSAVQSGRTGAGYANLNMSALGEGAEELAGLLEKYGVAKRTGANYLNTPDAEKAFFCGGGWLEEFAYQAVSSLGIKNADVSINVEGDWEGKGGKTARNEFDLHFLHNNRLYMISCKTARLGRREKGNAPGKEAVYELSSLVDRAGGLFGRAMLLSARRLADYDLSRARAWGIEVVEGRQVLQLGNRLKDWLAL